MLDVMDAYFCVPQKVPTAVSVLNGKNFEEYSLGLVLPGQPDGAQQRYLEATDYLRSELELRISPSHASLLKAGEKCHGSPDLSWKAFFHQA